MFGPARARSVVGNKYAAERAVGLRVDKPADRIGGGPQGGRGLHGVLKRKRAAMLAEYTCWLYWRARCMASCSVRLMVAPGEVAGGVCAMAAQVSARPKATISGIRGIEMFSICFGR